MDVQTEWVIIDVDGKPMKAYLARPNDGKTYPGVVVFMEIFGVNEHIQDVTRRLAAEGYVAIAPNFYHRQAPDLSLGYTPEAIEEGRKYKALVKHKDLLADAAAAVAYLQALPEVQPKNKMATIGFCFGGYVAFLAATLPEIGITASFYGAGIPNQSPDKEEAAIDYASKISGFMFMAFGEKDSSIPPSDIENIRKTLEENHVRHEIKVFPDSDHGFFCDRRDSYNPEAARAAWLEVTRLFAEYLKAVKV